MALIVKVRHTFGHRWMPFFLPVAASLLYIAIVVLLVPESFANKAKKASVDEEESFAAASASSTTDPTERAAARRRFRSGARAPTPVGAGIMPGGAQPAHPPPAPAPAAADGND